MCHMWVICTNHLTAAKIESNKSLSLKIEVRIGSYSDSPRDSLLCNPLKNHYIRLFTQLQKHTMEY